MNVQLMVKIALYSKHINKLNKRNVQQKGQADELLPKLHRSVRAPTGHTVSAVA